MTDEERAAMEWLDAWGREPIVAVVSRGDAHIRTLKAMLARPVMPEEPTNEILIRMDNALVGHPCNYDGMSKIYRALYAHLTAPPKAKVDLGNYEIRDEHGEIVGFFGNVQVTRTDRGPA